MGKVRDFFLGDTTETAAIGTVKELSGRPLGYDDQARLEASAGAVLRLRGRQALSLLMAAGLVVGGAHLATDREDEVPSAEQAKAPDQKLAQLEAKESKRFTVGPLELVQAEGLSDESFERLKDILTKAYPVYEKYIPLDSLSEKQILVQKHGNRSGAQAHYGQGVLLIGESVSDGLLLHELTHLLHGTNDLYYDLVEEGLATAISLLGTEELKMESWDRTVSLQMNQSLTDYLPVPPNMPYASNPNISPIRNEMAGYFWLDLEKAKPGAIKGFHSAYYDYLKAGGKKQDLYRQEVFEKIMQESGLADLYKKQLSTHTIAQVADGINNKEPKLFTYYVHFSNDGRRQLTVLAGMKDNEGKDKVLQKIKVEFSFENLDTGKKSQLFSSIVSDQKVTIDLDVPNKGTHFLKDSAGEGTRYRVYLKIPLPSGQILEESFEFDYL